MARTRTMTRIKNPEKIYAIRIYILILCDMEKSSFSSSTEDIIVHIPTAPVWRFPLSYTLKSTCFTVEIMMQKKMSSGLLQRHMNMNILN